MAARRRVQLHDGRHLGARLEPADRRKEELVWARRELLQRRGRVGARPEARRRERLLRACAHAHEAVGWREAPAPARPARAQRARERVVELQQVARASARLAAGEQPAQHRQVVLHLVDRAIRIVRRRPRQARARGGGRLALHPLRLRYAAGQRARDLQRVEGRHARARLRLLDARIREVQPPARGPDGQPQQQPLAAAALVLRRQRRAELAPQRIEQDRILARLLRKDPLGQPRQENDLEGSPARLLDRADEDASVAVFGWRLSQRRQLSRQDIAHLAERHGPDHVERPQRGQHRQHALRPS